MQDDINQYQDEVIERWGDTLAFKQSEERVKKMGKEGLNKVLEQSRNLTQEIALAMKNGCDPKSEKVQNLIEKHYDSLRAFYEPNPEMYVGLAKMYIDDPRFKENYDNIAIGLAQFMHDGMIEFVKGK